MELERSFNASGNGCFDPFLKVFPQTALIGFYKSAQPYASQAFQYFSVTDIQVA